MTDSKDTPLVVLVGRPNSGKSSIYNRLTGGDAVVANYPGVTVDLLHATMVLPKGTRVEVVDLPGFYSLNAVLDPKTDEGVARGFLEGAKASGRRVLVVQVVDGNRLGLGLRLTQDLLKDGWPLLVVVSQRDVTLDAGLDLDHAALQRRLGVPVLHVSAHEAAARDAVLQVVETQLARPLGPVDVLAWDPDVLAQQVMHDREDVDATMRSRRSLTDRVDSWLLHPVFGPALFLALMTLLFAAVFLVADPASAAVDAMVTLGRQLLSRLLGEGLFTQFLVDGVLAGAGTVFGFLPQVVLLSVGMEALYATGYLARGAFLVDRLLQLLGLSGRAFVPLLMGHACAVPAITATRVIRDPRERLTTILVLPLMTCSARIPTYGLILASFFSSQGPLVQAGMFVALYFSGVLSALVASWILRRTATRGRGLPLVMEMPDYRAPSAQVLLRKAWTASRDFTQQVGKTIVLASAVLWVLLNVTAPGEVVVDDGSPAIEHSVAARVGHALEPLTAPAGFDWRINIGLMASFGARELMVGTLGVIYGVENAGEDPAPLAQRLAEARHADGSRAYGVPTALSLLVFFVLACQCISTVAAIRRETHGWRWPLFTLAYTYAAAFIMSVVTFQGAKLLGL